MYRHVHYWFIELLTNMATSASQLLFDIKACASVNSDQIICVVFYATIYSILKMVLPAAWKNDHHMCTGPDYLSFKRKK